MKKLTIILALATALFATGCAHTTSIQAPAAHPETIDPIQPNRSLSHYDQGMLAWGRNQVVIAAREFKDAASLDDPKAEAMLGLLYLKGSGVFKSAVVGRSHAIAADQRPDFDAFEYYHQRWQKQQDADDAYLIAWILANRFSGQARADYAQWIIAAANLGHPEARWEVINYLN